MTESVRGEQPITAELLRNCEDAEETDKDTFTIWTVDGSAFIDLLMVDGVAVIAELNWDNQFEATLRNPTVEWLDFTLLSIRAAKEITVVNAR